jgi:hypothetical protein
MAAVDFAELILETVQGNQIQAPTLAAQKLYLPAQNAQLSPAPQTLDRSDEFRSFPGAPAQLLEGYAPAGTIKSNAYWKMLTWLFELAGFVGTHAAGDGVITDPDAATIPVGAHRWTFVKRDAINAQTAQLRLNHKDENVLLTGNGYAISKLDLNAAGALTAALMGLYVSRAAADAATVPAYESVYIPPLRKGELYLNWLAGGGMPSDFSLAIDNPLEGVNDLSQATTSFFPDVMEFGDNQAAVTGSIPKRVLAAADFDALLGLTTFSAVARWKSNKVIGATAYKYGLWVQMPACQYVSGDADPLANSRRVGASFNFFAGWDDVAGYDAKITLVNDITSIYA